MKVLDVVTIPNRGHLVTLDGADELLVGDSLRQNHFNRFAHWTVSSVEHGLDDKTRALLIGPLRPYKGKTVDHWALSQPTAKQQLKWVSEAAKQPCCGSFAWDRSFMNPVSDGEGGFHHPACPSLRPQPGRSL